MIVDPTKTQFSSTYQVDKVITYSSQTDSSGIGVNGYLIVGTPANPVLGGTYIATIPNPYGKKCLMTSSWSVDQINYLPQNMPLYYFNAVANSQLWQFNGFVGCSDSLIYFGVYTQYNANQNVYVQLALDIPE